MASRSVSRVSRRTVLIAGGGVAFLAACGGEKKKETKAPAGAATSAPQAAATGAPGQPKPGGTLKQPLVGISSGDPPTLYPYENLTYLAQIPSAFFYSRLLRSVSGPTIAPEDHTQLEGDAAAKLPEQPDDVTYIFTLKPNVKFHDKAPVNGRLATSRDWLQDWEAFRTKSQNAATFTGVIARVEAPDEKTVKFTLKEPFAPFLVTHMSSPEGLWLIPPETIEGGQVQTDPVGSGPWVFRQWEKGVALRFDRNPAWHDGPLPYFAKTEQSLNNDPQRILAALQTGDLDGSLLNGPSYEEAKKRLDPKGQDTFWGSQVQGGFYFNFDNKPWGDKRVRQALSMALDRDGYLKVQDLTKKGDWMSHLPPALAPYFMSPRNNKQEFGPNVKYYEKNIAEAKKLLEAAGFPSGFSFKLRANVDRYGAEAKQAWELFASTITEAGFKPELLYEEYGAYIQSTFLGKIPEGCAVGPLIGAARDPDDIFMRLYWSESPRHNWGGTPIPEMAQIDAMFVKQRKVLKHEDRLKEIKEIQRVMAESMLIVPYHRSAEYAYQQPWLLNYNWKNGYGYPTESAAKAWFTDERIRKG
jgi:peptide/nickel transport system substrate-binding protein